MRQIWALCLTVETTMLHSFIMRLGVFDKSHGDAYCGLLPLHQEPGKKSGKPGQVWFNQTYQAFVKKTSLVKSLVRLVLPGF